MVFLVACTVALCASLLTFFTGFGLGTLLLPALLPFFEPAVAVGLTAVVHLLNGLFKLVLVGRKANVSLATKFGVPAIVASIFGATLLAEISSVPPIATYFFAGQLREVTVVKLCLSFLMLMFAFMDLSKRMERLVIPLRFALLGGALTGFFGGLSGHQGGLRSAFLVRAGLSKEAFVATSVVISVAVDLTRLAVYGARFGKIEIEQHFALLTSVTLAAFVGAVLGSRLLNKVTLQGIQRIVALLLIVIAFGLGSGVL